MNIRPEYMKLADTLAAATDQLNEQLEEAECAFADLNLGVTASVSMLPSDPEERLGFGKLDGRWRLTYGALRRQPLVNASREQRLRAHDKLPELLLALVDEAKQQVTRVQEATASVRQFVQRFK